jgi:hypothetical protein
MQIPRLLQLTRKLRCAPLIGRKIINQLHPLRLTDFWVGIADAAAGQLPDLHGPLGEEPQRARAF